MFGTSLQRTSARLSHGIFIGLSFPDEHSPVCLINRWRPNIFKTDRLGTPHGGDYDCFAASRPPGWTMAMRIIEGEIDDSDGTSEDGDHYSVRPELPLGVARIRRAESPFG
jgi:hypothetical protein